uniref:Pre-rRNA-processing protein TSR2 n=1 Tax=Zea mays TaxID=4577 RepID=A0A804N4I3_MAIZE
MASSSRTADVAASRVLSEKGAAAMAECVGLLFGKWTALQLAVQNQWGGHDSQAKADRLASSVLSWFTRAAAARGAGALDPDELEDLLYVTMDESFNADIDDGGVEEGGAVSLKEAAIPAPR